MRAVSLLTCLIFDSVHSLLPLIASISSVFAEIIATGVLSSCEAFVTNCFCFSKFAAIGAIACLDRIMTRNVKISMMMNPHSRIYMDISRISHDADDVSTAIKV